MPRQSVTQQSVTVGQVLPRKLYPGRCFLAGRATILWPGPHQYQMECIMQHVSRRVSSRPSARSSAARAARAAKARISTDAVALLKADHRQVEEWFEQFEKARSASKKQDLAQRICQALTIHATIEEKIFYPAFLEATGEEDIHHEAAVEHASAKELIAQIEASSPEDEYFDAKVTVLSEMIKHHVKEEEQRGGMFSKAKAAGMDMEELAEQLMARKSELEGRRGRAH